MVSEQIQVQIKIHSKEDQQSNSKQYSVPTAPPPATTANNLHPLAEAARVCTQVHQMRLKITQHLMTVS